MCGSTSVKISQLSTGSETPISGCIVVPNALEKVGLLKCSNMKARLLLGCGVAIGCKPLFSMDMRGDGRECVHEAVL